VFGLQHINLITYGADVRSRVSGSVLVFSLAKLEAASGATTVCLCLFVLMSAFLLFCKVLFGLIIICRIQLLSVIKVPEGIYRIF